MNQVRAGHFREMPKNVDPDDRMKGMIFEWEGTPITDDEICSSSADPNGLLSDINPDNPPPFRFHHREMLAVSTSKIKHQCTGWQIGEGEGSSAIKRASHPVIKVPGITKRSQVAALHIDSWSFRSDMITLMFGLQRYHHLLILLGFIIATVMATEAMIIAAFPAIELEFGVASVITAWILPTVMLVGAVILLAVGSLGDIIGKRRVILVCLLVYGTGVILGGYAPDMLTLLLSRMLQGVGVAIAPLAYALVAEETPTEWVSTGIGVLAATYGAGSFIGIMTGAFIIEHFGWRACFIMMTPCVIALIISAWVILPKQMRVQKAGLDPVGMVLFAVSILSGMLALTQMGLAGIRDPLVWICLSISIISLLLFLRHEKRTDSPLIHLEMIREAPFPAITINAFLVVFSFFILLQVMPYLIASRAGLALGIVYVGILLMPGSLTDMVSGPLAGYLVAKKGVVLPFVFGSIALLIGCGIFFLFPLTPLLVVCIWMIFSAGMSILLTIDNMIAVATAPPGQTATASAFLHTIQSIGGAIGPIVAGATLTIYPGEEAFSVIFLIVLGVSGLIFFQSTGIRRHLP